MALHDRTAELDAYVAEHARHERDGNAESAAAVRGEVQRVVTEIEAEVAAKLAEAENHEAAGQEMLGARARTRVRELRTHLENAASSLPLENATPPRKRSGGQA